jgi:hypothetical protein
MAKAKKSVATRRRTSKARKAGAKAARKKVARRGKAKQARSKPKKGSKLAAKKQRPSKAAAGKPPRNAPRDVGEPLVEETIIDVVEEPVPGTFVVTEYETVQTAGSVPASPGDERRAGPNTDEK